MTGSDPELPPTDVDSTGSPYPRAQIVEDSEATQAHPNTDAGASDRNPWLFTPMLYLMQAIPVTLVQEVSSIIFKNLGVENSRITFWVSLIALPWSLQMLLGPFVDFNGSKRGWILWGQAGIVVGLIATVFALQLPNFFEVTLAILAVTAVFSALCNIATDGFYILALTKARQAAFVGLNSTFYRLGRLFCTGALVFVAGYLMKVPNVKVEVSGGELVLERSSGAKGEEKIERIVKPGATIMIKDERVQTVDGLTVTNGDTPKDPKEANPTWIKIPPATSRIEILPNGGVLAKPFQGEGTIVGRLSVVSPPGATATVTSEVEPGSPMKPQTAWAAVLGLCLLIYGLGRAVLPTTLPKPANDVVRPFNSKQVVETLSRTLLIIVVFICAMVFIGNVFKFIGHTISGSTNSLPILGDITTWRLSPTAMVEELKWLVGTFIVGVGGALLTRAQLAGTEMAEAFVSFVKQDRFMAIFGFILFYRFGEVMVSRISPLFYQDPTSKGGLALTVEQVGVVNGIMGVVGIILGGIAGGVVVSKLGLRKAFWPLVLAMHLPNLLYVWAAKAQPTLPGDPSFMQIVFSPISGIAFVDQFGYGFGFAAYMVYLMWVAQRGKFQTSHYAIGTGLGALCIAMAGIFSGIIQKNFGYFNFYLAVIFCTLPGMLMLLFIPLDKNEGRDIVVEAIGD